MAISLLSAGALGGCGDSGGGSASDSASDSQSGTGATEATESATEPTTSDSQSGGTTGASGGMSESMSGTTGAEGGMSESMSGSVSSSASESASGSGSTANTEGMTGGGETSDSTSGLDDSSSGEPFDCRSLENQADCEAAGCMPILGRKFVSDDADLCLDPPSFLSCEESAACAEVITTVCKGQVKYQLPNACIPEGFMQCPAPPDPGMDGFGDC